MTTDRFETAFGAYIDSSDYDKAEEDLFSIIRTAFLSGWAAASRERMQGKNTVGSPDTAIHP